MTTNYETMSFDTLSKIKVSEKPKENEVLFCFSEPQPIFDRRSKIQLSERNAK